MKTQIKYFSEPDINIKPIKQSTLLNRDFIPFGSDNLFPQALAFFARSSPNHRGVINSKVTYFCGEGIYPIDDKDIEAKEWIDNSNNQNQNLIITQERLFLDEQIIGNAYIEFITDAKHSFLFVNHIDATKCRLSKDGTEILLYPDWTKYTSKDGKDVIHRSLYPTFAADETGILRSVYHKKSYEPEFTYYGVPGWISGRDSVQIDFKTNRWNLSRLKKSMKISGTLIVPVSDEKEAQSVLENIEKHQKGEENAGDLLTITKGRAAENEKADQTQFLPTSQTDDGDWMNLHKQSLSDIIIAHSWYRSLSGVADNTGFDTQRILNEYSIAIKTAISKVQHSWIDIYSQVYYEILNKELNITFKNSPPLNDFRYYKIWEIRQAKGLDFDENDEMQQEIIRVN